MRLLILCKPPCRCCCTSGRTSCEDLLNVLESVKRAGAGFRSLKDTWADTTTPHGQLTILQARRV
jgi:DNA invertase Pin-like site-specific DNA recombinase